MYANSAVSDRQKHSPQQQKLQQQQQPPATTARTASAIVTATQQKLQLQLQQRHKMLFFKPQPQAICHICMKSTTAATNTSSNRNINIRL